MKLLVTGVNGQLGYDVCKVLAECGVEHWGVDIADFDITDAQAVRHTLTEYAPDVVVHCSAWTAVDAAEDSPEKTEAVNVGGTRNIAAVCRDLGCKMVYISTDYVFPGTGERFYEVDDETDPQSVYGRTKLGGELVVKELLTRYFIVRISWVFGTNGNNFIKTMLRLAETRDEISVVGDQIGSPTYTADLAPLLCDMVLTEKYGTYHATNEGVCSWAEFAEEIFRQAGKMTRVRHIPTNEYHAKAKRPMNSRLSKTSLRQNGFCLLPDWSDAVKRYLCSP